MNNKKEDIIVNMILAMIGINIILISILLYNKTIKDRFIDNKEDYVPKIKTNYERVNLVNYKNGDGEIKYNKTDNKIYSYLNECNNEIYTLIGEYGNIYPTSDNIISNYDKNKINSYTINFDENEKKYYYINETNKEKSELYNYISIAWYDENKSNHIIMYDEFKYYILNVNNNDLIELDNNLSILINSEQYYDKNYLIIKNNDNKYGIINYDGNVIIEPIYDNIKILENSFVVKLNNKVGIINKNEILVPLEYQYIFKEGNYFITFKNNKIGVLNENYQTIVENIINTNLKDPTCLFDDCKLDYMIEQYENKLYILNNISDTENNYLINNKGIENVLTNELKKIYKDNKIKYFYETNYNGNHIYLTIYDLDFEEYYRLELYNSNNNYELSITNIENTNYYTINIENYEKEDITYNTYYIDLFNSKKITELDALYKYFDNGYGYTLDINGILKIYKNDKLLDSFTNINGYLGNYYFFSNSISGKYTIYNLEFKKR